MTAPEALAVLAPIVGTGGLASILVALLAYLREARAAPRAQSPDPPSGDAAAASVERLADAIALLTLALARLPARAGEQPFSAEERRAIIEACRAVTALGATLDGAVRELRRDLFDALQD